ncbi:hypothetical protein [Kitasatospora purpeofusca]|uniref:hypothetical protein n=1 Tax=Kitasatospora purpeofusca TaxID=67352 RepID=UPI00225677C2|nr:hypothetical protein [Kitasatospora purpeofusca]MCX4752915.1 hypothetical protein [Kitasatospora purpeofusca]WSR32458.1 hypothetical protein OG715_16580 [Kitasatospora purpeofusca]WSR40546.1 hypothetical protein OG196_16365 [Kitasatospora purpeofusca]
MNFDDHRAAYSAGHDAVGQLLTVLTPLPTGITVNCPTWSHFEPTIDVRLHRDLPGLEAWAAILGATLTSTLHSNGWIHWSLTTEVNGVPVEAWTLIDAPDAAA